VQVPSVAEDPEKWTPVLKRICWYAVLAPSSSDQVTLLTTTAADKKLLELPAFKELLQTFITKEVQLSINPRGSTWGENLFFGFSL
jgi:26S proteasome regulatory subunit N5